MKVHNLKKKGMAFFEKKKKKLLRFREGKAQLLLKLKLKIRSMHWIIKHFSGKRKVFQLKTRYYFPCEIRRKLAFETFTNIKNARLLREIRLRSFLSNWEGGGTRPLEVDVANV